MSPELWGLFVSSLISSTLLPGGSEAYLAWLTVDGQYPTEQLIAIATLGNGLGGIITFAMGRLVAIRYPFRMLRQKSHRHVKLYLTRYGSVSLLLSWLPIVGDPLCFVAGWMKFNFLLSAIFIMLGKFLRYCVVAGIFL